MLVAAISSRLGVLWSRTSVVLQAASVALLTIGPAPAPAQDFLSPAPGSPFLTGGTSPTQLAIGDFNGDRRRDVVVLHSINNTVSVLLGDGRGGLSLAGEPTVTNGVSPVDLATGDFNGDRRLDVVTVNSSTDDVSLLLGDGTGGLSPVGIRGIPTGGDQPIEVATGDFNGDGKLDVAVGNDNTNNVSVLLGDGRGGLSPAPESPFGTGSQIMRQMVAGDFNGDGRLDVVIASSVSGGRVSVLLGDGQGRLSLASGSPLDPGAGAGSLTRMTAGNLNGDGRLDVVIGRNTPGNTVSVLLGDGQGAFSPGPDSPFATGGATPLSVTAADLDRDGSLDVAVANSNSGNVSVLLGDGQGRLNSVAGSPFATGGDGSSSLAVGDFNGDFAPDVVVLNGGSTSNNVSVLLGRRR